jgi:hypothetical protein
MSRLLAAIQTLFKRIGMTAEVSLGNDLKKSAE